MINKGALKKKYTGVGEGSFFRIKHYGNENL